MDDTLPAVDDVVEIPAVGPYSSVVFDSASPTVAFNKFFTDLPFQINSSSTLRFGDGDAETTGEGPFSFNSTLTMLGGTITGTGAVTVSGLMTWDGGTITDANTTPGNNVAFDVNGGLNLGGSGRTLNGRALNLSSNTSWATGTLNVNNGAVINNAANRVFDIRSGLLLQDTTDPTSTDEQFNNSGEVRRSTIAGEAVVRTRFTNFATGVIDVRTGTVDMRALTNFSSSTLTAGSYIVNGVLELPSTNGLVTNSADIVLDGDNSQFRHQTNDALTSFNNNSATGSFTIQNNRDFVAGAFSNTGSVTIGADSMFSTSGVNNYTQTSGSTVLFEQSSILDPGGIVDIQDGTLSGIGTVLGSVTNDSDVTPGNSAGKIVVDGDYTQSSGGTLTIEIGGTVAGATYDQLSVINGAVTLDGELNVSLISGFVPAVGNTFRILDKVSPGGISGPFFSGLSQGTTFSVGSTQFQISYQGGDDNNDVVLTVVQPSTVSIANASLDEGDVGNPQMSLVISLSAPAASTVSGTFSTGGDSAGENTDFVQQNGVPWSIAAGQSSTTISVPIIGDFLIEGDETFNVTLANLVNATAGDISAVCTITNDDNRVVTIADPPAIAEGNVGNKNLQFTISVNEARLDGPVTGTFSTGGNTASENSDFVHQVGTPWTIAQGATATTINVEIIGDTDTETAEDFNVILSGVSGADTNPSFGGKAAASGTIIDDDSAFPALPALSVGDRTQSETTAVGGTTGTTDFQFVVTLSAASTETVTVNFATNDVSAKGLVVSQLVGGLSRPVYLTTPPGELDRLFILEQHLGRIRIVDRTTSTLLSTPFLTIPGGVRNGNEEGLLGLAFHPDYLANGHFYVYFTNLSGDNQIRRFTRSAGDPNVADPASAQDVLTINHPGNSNHNGGWIGFGPDGFLYVAVGDGGSSDDPPNNAQDITDNLLGKVLRIDVNGDVFPESTRNYAIPVSNPFAGDIVGDDEIWAFGLRNPYRASFDADTGDLWIGDVGQNAREEIDFQPAGSAGGENYGWRAREGKIDNPNVPDPAPPGAVDPVYDYQHGIDPTLFQGFAEVGGYAYRGPISELVGNYFFGDNVSEGIWSIPATGNPVTSAIDWTGLFNPSATDRVIDSISSFGEDPAGNLFIVDLTGQIFAVMGGGDYDPISGQLTFAPGETSKTIFVKVMGDLVGEANETFQINLSGATNATIADNQGIGTIVDDDDPDPVVNAGPSQAVFEGDTVSIDATFTDPGANGTFTATIDWGDGDVDVVTVDNLNNTLTGEHVYGDNGLFTITVEIEGSDTTEGFDTVIVNVSNAAPEVAPIGTAILNEGLFFNVLQAYHDAGFLDTLSGTIDWGDGTPLEPLNFEIHPVIGPVVQAGHVYADNDTYSGTLTLNDDDGGQVAVPFEAIVLNVAPTVNAGDDVTVNEGQTLDLLPIAGTHFTNVVNNVTNYAKWGSPTLGTGAVVTWSLIPDGTDVRRSPAANPFIFQNSWDGPSNLQSIYAQLDAATPAPNDGQSLFNAALTNAFARWSEATNLTFVQVADTGLPLADPNATGPNAGDIRIGAFPLSGTFSCCAAFGFEPPGANSALQATNPTALGDISLNSLAFFSTFPGLVEGNPQPAFPNDLESLLIHEIGHAIGLGHPEADGLDPGEKDAIMYVGPDCCGTVQRTLGDIDEHAIRFLYSTGVRPAFSDPGFDYDPLPVGGIATQENFTVTIDWGDGSPEQSGTVVENPGLPFQPTTGGIRGSHVYADNGTYTVTIEVCDDDLECGTDSFTVTVNNVAPTLTAGANRTVNEGAQTSFQDIASFTDPGFNNPNNPGPNSEKTEEFTITIDWGDGTPLDGGSLGVLIGGPGVLTVGTASGLHTYVDNGVYTVTVTIFDDDGGSDEASFQATVNNVSPTVDAGGPYNVNEGGTAQLNGSATDPAGGFDPLTLDWDLDNDGLFGAEDTNQERGNETIVAPVFSAAGLDGPGTFPVSLRARDGDGGVDIELVQLSLVNVPPQLVDAGGPYSVNSGGTVQLTGTASDPAGLLDPLTFSWDLDGDSLFGADDPNPLRGVETGANPTFNATGLPAGPVIISLRVSDGDGGVGEDTATINVISVACGLIVTSTANSGPGSLREAINCANTTANIDRGGTSAVDPDPITFAIPTTDPGFVDANNDDIRDPGDFWSILPLSALPTISEPVIIDGYTQSGASRNSLANGNNAALLIELNGASAGASVVGLTISAGTSTVSGLVINRFSLQGIRLLTNGGNLVEGNFIGTDVAGTADLGNAGSGVLIDTANNEIGGTTPGARNIISGNNSSGVSISGSAATGNLVRGNLIGTDASGSLDRGNNVSGVFIDGAPQNVIGGITAEARNVISGNNQFGLNLVGSGATGNLIQGNFIGTDASGTLDLGNSFNGITLNGAPGNTIGGTAPGARNVISGHGQWGINMSNATGNLVQGNFIGTDVTGSIDIGNSREGILLSVSSGNTIGGTAAGAGNLISGNDFSGVTINGNNNLVQGNFIGTNATGTAALGNGRDGVEVGSNGLTTSNNTIGGTIPGARNIISGNGRNGVQFVGGGSFTNTSNNLVQGNYIGTDVTGTADLGNSFDGVSISGASNNTVGGVTLEARNIISGNNRHGVAFFTGTINGVTRIASGNVIQGNFIGTDVSGTLAMANGANGVHVQDAPNNTIGGTVAGARNVISGNGADGINLMNSGTTGTLVQGNFIGTQADGISALGNSVHGVVVTNSSNNTVGGIGVTPGACDGPCNVIAFNSSGSTGAEGVHILSGTGNAILGNAIYSNGELGIDLGTDDVVTLNDPGDADAGANNLQNFPVLELATIAEGNLTLTGFARPGVVLELFIAATDPSGFGEGRTFLARLTEDSAADQDGTTGTYGPGTVNGLSQGDDTTNRFRFVIPLASLPGVAVGTALTATATDGSSNTSEFSGIVTAVSPTPTVTLSLTGSPLAENGGAATVTATLSAVSGQAVTVSLGFTGTAGGSDYTASDASITIPAGSLSGSITLTGVNDALDELNETVIVDVSAVTNGTESGTQQVTATITDDDDPPAISISNVTVSEGNTGTKLADFIVSLSAASSQTVTVNYATANNTASTADSDYVGVPTTTLTFAPGETVKTVSVTINGDHKIEQAETFLVDLSSPNNATIVDGQGQGTISNDDNRTVSLAGNASVDEGNIAAHDRRLTFTVNLSEAIPEAVTVRVDASDISALAGQDYVALLNHTVTIAANQTSATLQVEVLEDFLVEPSETLQVSLSSVSSNASIGTSSASGTINNDDNRTVSLAGNANVDEGNLAAHDRRLTFTVNLSEAIPEAVTVRVDTSDISALAGQDYVALTNHTVTIPANQTSATFQVEVLEDFLVEPSETLQVSLSSVSSNASIGTSSATGTINNDDTLSFSISDVTQAEGNAGNTAFNFIVSLSATPSAPVTVLVNTANDTATAADIDFTAITNQTLTFNAAGSQTVTVDVIGDTKEEPTETFFVNLSDPSPGAAIADGQGVGTITNDDNQPTISINDVSQNEGNSGQTAFVFTVGLSNASSQQITVDFATANNSATTADGDYSSAIGSLTFAAGTTTLSQTITVQANGDTKFEPTEQFLVNLSNLVNASTSGNDLQGIGTISNDDTQPAVSISDVSQNEGNSGQAAFVFTVSLSNASSQQITVDFATANDSATTANNDYASASGTVTFAAGSTIPQSVTVQVNGDTNVEPNESFLIILENALGGATILDNQGIGTITNDDFVTPSFSINDVAVNEGNAGTANATFTLTLSSQPTEPASVTLNTVNGSATTDDLDYDALSNLVRTFNPGDPLTQTITVTVRGDTKFEPMESFFVNLSSATGGAVIGDATGEGTITNDDNQPTISINDVSHDEGNSGQTTYVFTVSLSNPSDEQITLDFAAANDSATTTDGDYASASSSLTFIPGTTTLTQTITIHVNGDSKFEPTEQFFVNISSVQNAATIGNDLQGVGTITNDDSQPTISINDVSQNEGNSGQTAFVFTVSLSNASSQQITLDFATANDSATIADGDYSSAAGSLTFAVGTTTLSQAITVQVNGDTKFEQDQSFFVNLTNATGGAVIGDNQGVGTISNDDSRPTIMIAAASSSEGDPLTLSLSLSNASDEVVTVLGTVNDGTATTADNDYTDINGQTITFAAGVTTSQFVVQTIEDTKFEADQTVSVALSGAVNASGTSGSPATGTIVNDDVRPTITIAAASASEGDQLVFNLSLSNLSDEVVTVVATTSDGTATTADNDYTPVTEQTVTFAAGTSAATLPVQSLEDTIFEADQTFTVALTDPGNAGGVAGSPATGTINNDDVRPTITIASASASEGGPVVFNLTLSNLSDEVVTVQATTADGTATTADNDYTPLSGQTLTFAARASAGIVTAQSAEDTKFEANQTFTVALAGGSNYAALTGSPATGTINNDDVRPTVTIGPASAAEGDQLIFNLSLSNLSDEVVSVLATTADGTATTANNDYAPLTNQAVNFAAGTSTATLAVQSIEDTSIETSETFTVTLTATATAGGVAGNPATGTITNDDSAAPTFSIDDVSVFEGNSGTTLATFTVTLTNNPLAGPVSVTVNTADNTATDADNDYEPLPTAPSTVLTFTAAGTQTVSVIVNGDTRFEVGQTFFVNLSNATGGAIIGDGQGVGLINNDDARPTITIAAASASEGETLLFILTLSNTSDEPITVQATVNDGTATTADNDYADINGQTIMFADSVTTAQFAVQTIEDTKFEADQTVSVILNGTGGTSTAGDPATGTIVNDDVRPTITIAAASASEGDQLEFNLSLSNLSDEVVTVQATTTDGTATTADNDYTPIAAQTVTFAAGAKLATLPLQSIEDTKFEANQTFTVALSGGANYGGIAGSPASGTINNDDVRPTVNIAAASASEGDALTFNLSLSNASDETVTVLATVNDGSATTADSDYSDVNGQLVSFGPGLTAAQFPVQTTEDTKFEGDESFTVSLSGAVNGTAGSSAVGTIGNDDTRPRVSITDVSQNEGNSGTTNYVFTVTLSNASSEVVTVNYATADESATVADGDYASASGSLTFAAGTTTLSQTVSVNVNGDAKFEPSEQFFVNLSGLSNAASSGNDLQGIGTITNDDNQPTISINDVSQIEGNFGQTAFVFTVNLSNASSQQITVDFSTADDSATTANNDYVPASGKLTFPANATSPQSITVQINGDTFVETTETFFVNLSGALGGATILENQGLGTITNDDVVAPAISINDVTLAEGNGGTTSFLFTVTLSQNPTQQVTVVYSTQDDTATAGGSTSAGGNDYVAATNQTLTFNPNDSLTQTISIAVNGDVTFESSEQFTVNLSAPTGGAVINDGQGVGAIENDEDQPQFFFFPNPLPGQTVTEGDAATTPASFTVNMSRHSQLTASVVFSTANDSAIAPGDYAAITSQILTFNPGDNLERIATVNVAGDLLDEPTETYLANLSSPVNATLGLATTTGTILDNDPAPALTVTGNQVQEGNVPGDESKVTFTLTLDAPSGFAISGTVATSSGTAIENEDFQSIDGTQFTIPAGQTQVTIDVPIIEDVAYANNESFTLTATVSSTSVVSNTNGQASGTGTILNDDAQTVVTISDPSVPEGGNLVFSVSVNNPVENTAITFSYDVLDGTALRSDNDYSGAFDFALTVAHNQATGQTTFSPSQFVIPTTHDTKFERDETVLLDFAGSTTTGDGVGLSISVDAAATGTFTNNDTAPTLTVIVGSVPEGNVLADDSKVPFTLALSAISGVAVTGTLTTTGGSATEGADFESLDNTSFTIPTGTQQITLHVPVVEETSIEPNEDFTLTAAVADPTAITAAGSTLTGTGIIQNDDFAAPSFSVNDVQITEGNAGTKLATFTVTFAGTVTGPVSVTVATDDSSATDADNDYEPLGATTLTFNSAGTQQVSVTINGDTKFELDETFFVNLTNPQGGAVIADSQGVGTIQSDDARPTINLVPLDAANEGNSGTTSRLVRAELTNASDEIIQVELLALNVTSVAPGDFTFTPNPTTLTFPAGSLAQTTNVQIVSDTLFESDEQFRVRLQNPQNATLGTTGQIDVTILNDDFPPVFSIDNVSLAEGNSGTKLFTFTVSLTGPTDLPASVQVQSQDGTATAGEDYTALQLATLDFPVGTTTRQVSVTVSGDTKFESDQTFLLNLLNPSNATVAAGPAGTGTGTIVNDDARPTINLVPLAAASEGNSGTTTRQVNVELSNASDEVVAIELLALNLTANAPADYILFNPNPITLTFQPGAPLLQSRGVEIVGDTLFERDETFRLLLQDPTNGSIGATGQIDVGILNDDAAPTLTVTGASVVEGNVLSDDSKVPFTLALLGLSGVDVIGTLSTSGILASEGADFESLDNTPFTIAAGAQQITIHVPVVEDTSVEPNEDFTVTATVADPTTITAAGSTLTGTGTIRNDDFPAPSFSIDDVRLSEGNAGTTNLVFTVTLSGNVTLPATVKVSTSDDSATDTDNDYEPLATNFFLSFAAAGTQQVVVAVNGDSKFEDDQEFAVVLADPTGGAVLARARGIGTILNDDVRPTVSLVPLAAANEGDTGFVDRPVTVQLSHASDEEITIEIVALGLSAATPLDYTFASPTAMTFSPGGPLSQTVDVRINGDTLFERDEHFRLQLQNPENATIGATGQIDVGILNDDTAPTLTVKGGSVQEGNVSSDNSVISFTLELSAASGVAVTGTLSTNGISATENIDFDSQAGIPFTIDAGTRQITVQVPIVEETEFEGDESFTLIATVADPTTVSNPNAAASDLGTILNDDAAGPPALSPIAFTDDLSVGYRERGLWNSGPVGAGFQGDVRTQSAGVGTRSATWRMMNIPFGRYEVYSSWTPGPDRASDARYTVFDGSINRGSADVDQIVAANDGSFLGSTWESLGFFEIHSGSLVVQLSDNANGVVVADGILAVPRPIGGAGEGESVISSTRAIDLAIETDLLAPLVSLDANDDGRIAPNDVLNVVNQINSGVRTAPGASGLGGEASIDVNADQFVSSIDALLIINHINAYGSTPTLAENAEAEGADAYFTDLGSRGDDDAQRFLGEYLDGVFLGSRAKKRSK